ncbi:hypothetical protein LCGC14_0479280 [marine sediment metagenome]|uniref:Uncharacterized protein n=1 Tax=marine sediment metagenome TaxID=412755 RepID=A0A0F9SSU6_9ZZZZ
MANSISNEHPNLAADVIKAIEDCLEKSGPPTFSEVCKRLGEMYGALPFWKIEEFINILMDEDQLDGWYTFDGQFYDQGQDTKVYV